MVDCISARLERGGRAGVGYICVNRWIATINQFLLLFLIEGVIPLPVEANVCISGVNKDSTCQPIGTYLLHYFHFLPQRRLPFASSCFSSSSTSSFSALTDRRLLFLLGFMVVWSSTISNRSSRSRKPRYTSSHTNSSVYVVFF